MKAYRFILALSVLAVSACSVKEINETAKTSERELTIEAYRAAEGKPAGSYRVVSFRQKKTRKSWNGRVDG